MEKGATAIRQKLAAVKVRMGFHRATVTFIVADARGTSGLRYDYL